VCSISQFALDVKAAVEQVLPLLASHSEIVNAAGNLKDLAERVRV